MNKRSFLDCVDVVGSSVKEYSGIRKYVSTGALDCDHIDADAVEEYSFSEKPSRANLEVDEGCLLFAKMQGTKKTLMIDKENQHSIYSTGFAAVRPKDGIITARCLYHLVTSDDFLKQKDLNCSGATQKAITNEGMKKIIVSIPDIEDQERIAKILDKVDELIRMLYRNSSIFDEIVKSRFVEMFGDPDLNPMGWEEILLSEKLDVLGGYAFKSDEFDEETGIPVLRIGNINAGYFRSVNMVYWHEDENLEKYAIYPGDLVMSLTGTVGKDDYGNVCILGDDFNKYYLNQRNAKLEIKEGLDKLYLSVILKFETIKKRLTGISRGVRQANIANRDILNLCIPVPPITIQNQFADFVKQVDKSKLAVQKELQKLEILKKSLMQQYFG